MDLNGGSYINNAGAECGFVYNLCVFDKLFKLGDARLVFCLRVSCLVVFAVLGKVAVASRLCKLSLDLNSADVFQMCQLIEQLLIALVGIVCELGLLHYNKIL